MSKRYAYYPGCSGQGTSIEYDVSTRVVCKALGIELVDVPDWSCCGSTPAHTVDHTLSSALSGRNLAQAQSMNVEGLVTPCPSCLTNLKTAAKRLSDEMFRERVNSLLDKPVHTLLPVKSVLQVIFEDIGPAEIAKRVVRPLTGLKLAPYYGCITTRPPKLMEFDNPENPISMDELMKALGATVMDFPLKVECCGASHGVTRQDIVAKLSGKLLETVDTVGAEAVVTACPLCQMNLDLRQAQVNRGTGASHDYPVFYYTQLIGLALGMSEKDVGLDKLAVSPGRILRAMDEAQNAKETAEA